MQSAPADREYQRLESANQHLPGYRVDCGRRIKQTPPAAGKELAYRVVLDEIPTPRNPGENQAGLTFQRRYSVPLFVYGTGLNTDSARPALRW